MALLSEADYDEVTAGIMRGLSRVREPTPFLKTHLRAVVVAIDVWCNDNAASFNAALPQPFRGTATPAHKSRFFEAVVAKRRERGS